MLRAFGSELRWMDREGLRGRAGRAARSVALGGAMFLLCRARPAGQLAPFAMAFFAAALLAGRRAAGLLAGCLLGALGGALGDYALGLPIGAAIVLAGALGWETVVARRGIRGPRAARRPGPRLLARSPNRRGTGEAAWEDADAPSLDPRGDEGCQGGDLRQGDDLRSGDDLRQGGDLRQGDDLRPGGDLRRGAVACAALAGAGTLAPGLMAAGGALWPSIQATAAAIAAAAAAPFLRGAMDVRPGRRFLLPEERAGLAILGSALAAGLASVWLPAGAFAAAGLALLAYPAGALVGVGAGLTLLAMGRGPGLSAVICAGGAAAQLCARAAAGSRAGASGTAMLVLSLYMGLPAAQIAGCCAAALACGLLPPRWARLPAAWARPEQGPCDPERLAARLRWQSAERLNALGAAFGELAEGFLAPGAMPDEQALLSEMRRALCAGCGRYAECWAGDSNRAADFLCALVAEAVDWADEGAERPLFEGEMPPSALRRCRRGRLVPERLQGLLEDFALARRAELKRGAESRLVSAQFLQARQLLEALAEDQAAPIRLRSRQAARAAAALERAGIGVADVVMLGGPRVELAIALREGRWTPALARAAAARLSRTFGRVYAPEGPWGRELSFVRRPPLRAETGAACAPREAGVASGDSHLLCMLDDERLLALICDGMGSGDAAARESAAAVRLLGRFLAAGADRALAIETVNAMLLSRSRDDMFATVDMLILNLSTGQAEFVKLAACPTLVVREGRASAVPGGRLPLGILERVQPAVSRMRLLPGDVICMASDGVMDVLAREDMEALARGEASMTALAERLLSAAGSAPDRRRRDDMTALCLRLVPRAG